MNALKIKNISKCAIFVCLIIVGSFIKIPIPYVPFTLQFLFTNLAGILLGSKLGSLSVFVYVIMGLIGIPIFAEGGGIAYILKPTFGYLIGFILGAFFTGIIVERNNNNSTKKFLIASFVGLSIVYILGLIYYYIISKFFLKLDTKVSNILIYGLFLAIPGDIVLCFISSALGKRLKVILK